MRFLNIVCLIALILISIYFLTFHNIPEELPGTPVFSEIEAKDINSITVQMQSDYYKLVEKDNHWILDNKPWQHVSADVVDRLKRALLGLHSFNSISIDRDTDWSAYGLYNSSSKISFTRGDLKEVIVFGNLQEISGRRYARLGDGSEFILVDEAALDAFRLSIEDLRDTRPFHSLVINDLEFTSIGKEHGEIAKFIDSLSKFSVLSYFNFSDKNIPEGEIVFKMKTKSSGVIEFRIIGQLRGSDEEAPYRGIIINTPRIEEVVFSAAEYKKLMGI